LPFPRKIAIWCLFLSCEFVTRREIIKYLYLLFLGRLFFSFFFVCRLPVAMAKIRLICQRRIYLLFRCTMHLYVQVEMLVFVCFIQSVTWNELAGSVCRPEERRGFDVRLWIPFLYARGYFVLWEEISESCLLIKLDRSQRLWAVMYVALKRGGALTLDSGYLSPNVEEFLCLEITFESW